MIAETKWPGTREVSFREDAKGLKEGEVITLPLTINPVRVEEVDENGFTYLGLISTFRIVMRGRVEYNENGNGKVYMKDIENLKPFSKEHTEAYAKLESVEIIVPSIRRKIK